MFPTTLAALALLADPAPPPRPPGLAAGLAAPVRVLAGGKPLDVERSGHAAPFVGDADGDGKPDLLVGQFDRGRLRVYRNAAAAGAPKFDGYSWFEASDAPGTVPPKCYMGFTPQLVDLDGDGKPDVLSGSHAGEVYFFRREADGRFAGGEALTHPGGKAVNVNWSAATFAADWDGDGRPDLIVGTGLGEVFVLSNAGTPGRPAFGDPKPLSAGGQPLKIPSGMAAPAVADWDGDGKPDLVVGAEDGSVVWFRNGGTAKAPRLSAAQTLVPASPAKWSNSKLRGPGEWGTRVKPCVFDWDGDGKPDLLIGDVGGWFEAKPSRTAEEAGEEKDATDRLPGVRAEWAAALKELTAASGGGREAEMRRRVTGLKDEIVRLQDTRDRYRTQSMTHGHVWLFLRRPAGK